MPQITNLTIGAAVSLTAVADRVFRAVPQPRSAESTGWEYSESGQAELAQKIAMSTSRTARYEQRSLTRVTHPLVRNVNEVPTKMGNNVAQVSWTFAPGSTTAEKQALVDDLIRAISHSFAQAVLVSGESIN